MKKKIILWIIIIINNKMDIINNENDIKNNKQIKEEKKK